MAKEPTVKPVEPVPQATVEALTTIDHDGVRYEAGATIPMTPEQAEALIALGAAKPAA